MHREQYRQLTDISSPDEAHDLIAKTKLIFIAGFVVMAGSIYYARVYSAADTRIALLLSAFEWGYLFFIGWHTYQVIQKTKKVNRANVFLAIFFAPISWLWLYPELVKPLKIITGEIDTPEHIEDRTQNLEAAAEYNRNYWRKFFKVTAILGAIFFAAILALLLSIRS